MWRHGGWDVFGEVLFDNVWVPAAIFVTQYQTRHGHNASTCVTCAIHTNCHQIKKLQDSQLFWSNWEKRNSVKRIYLLTDPNLLTNLNTRLLKAIKKLLSNIVSCHLLSCSLNKTLFEHWGTLLTTIIYFKLTNDESKRFCFVSRTLVIQKRQKLNLHL